MFSDKWFKKHILSVYGRLLGSLSHYEVRCCDSDDEKKMEQRKPLVTDTTLDKSFLYLTETYLTIPIRLSIFKQHAHILSVLSVLENVLFLHKNY